MDQLVPAGDDHDVARDRRRGVEGEVAFRVFVAPTQCSGPDIYRQYLVVEGAVVERVVEDCRGRGGVGARVEAQHLGSVRDPDPAQHGVASRDPGKPVRPARGGVHRPLGLQLPAEFAGGPVHGVEVFVIAADQHQIVRHDGGGFDLGAGREAPPNLAGFHVDRVQDPEQVSDEHGAVRNRRRGFPEAILLELSRFRFGGAGAIAPGLGAVFEVQLHQHSREGGGVDEPARYRR